MKYLEQREKVIQAYYNNELNPYNECACFIGNLLNNSDEWSACRKPTGVWEWVKGVLIENNESPNYQYSKSFIEEESNNFYKVKDIIDLESNFLQTIYKHIKCDSMNDTKKHPNYEEALFLAMDSTLDLLLEIHKRNGDESVLDLEKPVFNKRQLEKV